MAFRLRQRRGRALYAGGCTALAVLGCVATTAAVNAGSLKQGDAGRAAWHPPHTARTATY